MSKKVKLVFVKSFLDIPTFRDTFASDIEVEVPEGFDSVHLIGARIYGAEPAPGEHMITEMPSGDANTTILEYRDVNQLVGQLLTYIDATFTDPEQRKAHKDIVKEKVHNWHNDLRVRGVQTVDSHTAAKPYVGTIDQNS